MGCCCSGSKTQDTSAREAGQKDEHEVKSATTNFSRRSLVEPERVQNLTATKHPSLPVITLSWEAPANVSVSGKVMQYSIKISPCSSSASSLPSSGDGDDSELEPPMEVKVDGDTTKLELSDKDGLKPLHGYRFNVQAISISYKKSAWSTVESHVDWVCRLPDCDQNRLMLEDGDIYNFCSREHKIKYDEGYCLHPECSKPVPTSPISSTPPPSPVTVSFKSMNTQKNHFCSDDHFQETVTKRSEIFHSKNPHNSGVFFVKVEPSCQEYQDIETTFQKKWTSKEKTCPQLNLVLAILNPSQDAKFMDYKHVYNVTEKKDIIKTFFFGTNLGCDLYNYQSPCKNVFNFKKCKVCNLASEGFSKLIYQNNPNFVLFQNPADAHNKAQPHSDSFTYGLLMCDVVCVNITKVKHDNDSKERPDGIDATIVKQTDEIKIYNANTVCPRYILCY